MWVTTIVIGLFGYLVIAWISQRRKKHAILRNLGIPGPEPGLLLGNVVAFKDKGFHAVLEEWADTYGQTFGYYEGEKPIIVTSDVHLLKQVLIKDFDKFHTRKAYPLAKPHGKTADLLIAIGERWRRLRSISSPSFSSKRMKEMSPLINLNVDNFLDAMEQRCKEGKAFNLHGIFQHLTLDVIACCAFGLEISSVKNADEVFVQNCRRIFRQAEDPETPIKIAVLFAIIFPGIVPLIHKILGLFIELPRDWFLNTAARIINSRRIQKADRVDFIQLMLDAEESEVPLSYDALTVDLDREPDVVPETSGKKTGKKGKSKGMIMEEMQAQCMLFLLAGYETTSTALGFFAYDMALHADIQSKLQREIDQHFPDLTDIPDYYSVEKLRYLDMVLRESLRLHPIAQMATCRMCNEDCVINGQFFPRGVYVQVHMNAIHFDPEHWGPEDPSEFVPERFTAERTTARHPLAWLPFGVGPRNCLGMRFALMEIKITVVRILQRYEIQRCDQTKVPLSLAKNVIRGPAEGVFVVLQSRNR